MENNQPVFERQYVCFAVPFLLSLQSGAQEPPHQCSWKWKYSEDPLSVAQGWGRIIGVKRPVLQPLLCRLRDMCALVGH